jgi:hypothetical protein
LTPDEADSSIESWVPESSSTHSLRAIRRASGFLRQRPEELHGASTRTPLKIPCLCLSGFFPFHSEVLILGKAARGAFLEVGQLVFADICCEYRALAFHQGCELKRFSAASGTCVPPHFAGFRGTCQPYALRRKILQFKKAFLEFLRP